LAETEGKAAGRADTSPTRVGCHHDPTKEGAIIGRDEDVKAAFLALFLVVEFFVFSNLSTCGIRPNIEPYNNRGATEAAFFFFPSLPILVVT
jgi:hypothetical protein